MDLVSFFRGGSNLPRQLTFVSRATRRRNSCWNANALWHVPFKVAPSACFVRANLRTVPDPAGVDFQRELRERAVARAADGRSVLFCDGLRIAAVRERGHVANAFPQ